MSRGAGSQGANPSGQGIQGQSSPRTPWGQAPGWGTFEQDPRLLSLPLLALSRVNDADTPGGWPRALPIEAKSIEFFHQCTPVSLSYPLLLGYVNSLCLPFLS